MSATISQSAYSIALEGVTRFSLETAARKILKGHLNHTFFPSPAEIRMVCDEVTRLISEDAYRDKVTAQSLNYGRTTPPLSQEAKERMTALWERTKAANKAKEDEGNDNSVEAAMSRLEALARSNGKEVDWSKLTDQREPSDWVKGR